MSRTKSAEGLQSALQKLFVTYASYGTKGHQSYLRVPRFLAMMEDAGIPDEQLGLKQLEMVFFRENKHKPNVNFQVFLEVLTQVAREKYRNLFEAKPSHAFLTLVEEHLMPLLTRVIEQETGDSGVTFTVDEDCKALFASVYESIKDLYFAYFPWEVEADSPSEVLANRSWQGLSTFLREFDICPTLVSKNNVARLWRELVVMQDSAEQLTLALLPAVELELGQSLTLSKFMMLLLQAAERGYEDDVTIKQSPSSEKLLILLERMQLSKGVETLERRLGRPLRLRGALAPPSRLVHQVLYPEAVDIDEFSRQSIHSSEVEETTSLSALSLNPEGLTKLDPFLERIQHIFQAYCSFGDPMNTTRLKSSNYMRMMRDCGAVRSEETRFSKKPLMESVEIDLLFTRLTGPNKKTRPKSGQFRSGNQQGQSSSTWRVLEFQQFLKSLEAVSTRLYPDAALETAYISFIQDYFLQLENEWNDERGVSSNYIKQLMELLKDQDMIEVLILVHKSIIYFYRYYADARGLLNFENFIRFAKDFNLFPDLIAKSKLLRFFYTMASIHSQTEQPEISVSSHSSRADSSRGSEQDSADVIDEHLFVETLALVACEVVYPEPEPSPVEKVCLLMERMNQSAGPRTVLLAFGHNRAGAGETDDLLFYLREQYPQVFAKSMPKARVGFNDVLSGLQRD